MDIIYPQFYCFLVSNNEAKKVEKIKLYSNFKSNKELIELLKLENKNSKRIGENFDKFHKKLTKKQSEELYKYPLLSFTFNLDYFKKKFNIKYGWSNAWRKMYELCERTKIIPDQKIIKHFDICSLPGSFIGALDHYIKTNRKENEYEWYFQSCIGSKKEEHNYFSDRYNLVKKNKDKFIIKDKGDITNYKEILHIKDFFKNNKRNLVTSDCGLEQDMLASYTREKKMSKILLGTYLSSISILEEGGNLVMKFYNFYSNFNISLFYLMTQNFKKVYLIKPESSRQFSGTELYIVCIGFLNNIDENNFNNMLDILKNFKGDDILNKSLISYTKINKEQLEKIYNVLTKYYCKRMTLVEERNKLKNKLIDSTEEDSCEVYLEKKKKAYDKIKPLENKYFNNYFKRMKYKKYPN